MYITRIPNRGSPPAILLREGYRQDGRVKTRTLANLSKLQTRPSAEAISGVLFSGFIPSRDGSEFGLLIR